MPFSVQFMRPQACRIPHPVQTVLHAARLDKRDEKIFRMAAHERTDHLLVLSRIKRAGRIQQAAAGLDQPVRGLQNFLLKLHAELRFEFSPAFDGLRILSEHSFAGAGRVYEDFIKILGKIRPEPVRRFVRHDRISYARELKIVNQRLYPFLADIVGDQQPRSL